MYLQHKLLAKKITAVKHTHTPSTHTHIYKHALPQRLRHQLNRVFLTSSHQCSKAVGFFPLTSKPIILLSLSWNQRLPWGCGTLCFSSSFPTRIQIVCVPRNNRDGKTKQTQGMFLLSLQRSGIVYCLPLIAFSLLFLCVITHYFEHAMCGTQWHAPHNFKHAVTQPRVVTEGLKVYLQCALYKIVF